MNPEFVGQQDLAELISTAKALAKRYYELTGRPLGITGEVAEFEAARLLGLRLADVRQSGYDAIQGEGPDACRLQVKSRCILDKSKPGQRLGAIKLDREWDAVLLVLLDHDFEPTEIYEAGRPEITDALLSPGSKARNERGALSVSKFKAIGHLVWSRRSGRST